MKPLGHKAYGSIPHLPLSRLGPGDYHCHEGQARICTQKARDKNDRVIVTEKLDGSNVCIANIGGSIAALARSGYLAKTSPYQLHHAFADWVMDRTWSIPNNHRICGEWMHTAHGTIYENVPIFVAFDAFDAGNKRLSHDDARLLFDGCGVPAAAIVSDGPPMTTDAIMALIGDRGSYGAVDPVEGAVWRVERKGVFDFMAKFVRHDKSDGKYLQSVTGLDPVVMVTK